MQVPGAPAPREFFATRMGVYYPNHHAVLAIEGEQAVSALRDDLTSAGFASDGVYVAPPAEMASFLRDTEAKAGVLAQVVGSELKQTEILLQLAETGCHFLIVRIGDEAQKEKLIRLAARYPLHKAIYFHTLAIEELPIGDHAIPGSSPYGINEIPRDDV